MKRHSPTIAVLLFSWPLLVRAQETSLSPNDIVTLVFRGLCFVFLVGSILYIRAVRLSANGRMTRSKKKRTLTALVVAVISALLLIFAHIIVNFIFRPSEAYNPYPSYAQVKSITRYESCSRFVAETKWGSDNGRVCILAVEGAPHSRYVGPKGPENTKCHTASVSYFEFHKNHYEDLCDR